MLATEILAADHAAAMDLIEALKNVRNNERAHRDNFRELDAALRLHMRLEEEIFYPEMETDREFAGLMERSKPEHDKARRMLDEMKELPPSNGRFQELLLELKLALNEHMVEEESDVFPRAIAVFGADRIDDLGTRLDIARAEAESARSASM